MPRRHPHIATPAARAAELLELWLRLDDPLAGLTGAAYNRLLRRTRKLIKELRRA